MSALGIPHGVHRDIPSVIYHARELGCASKSTLDILGNQSPAHLKAYVEGVADDEPTPSLIFGSAFHMRKLEPQRFHITYAVEPDFGDCRFKENKAKRDAWRAANAGKTPLDHEDAARIEAMCASIDRHPLASKIIADGESELTLRWRDEGTGVECKARLDYFVARHKMIADLKSAEDASPEAFRKAIANYWYHRQDAFYRAGSLACGLDVEHFIFVVVEKKPPHEVAIYSLEAAAIAKGAESISRDLRTYAECMKTGVWPGYGNEIKPLGLPGWAA